MLLCLAHQLPVRDRQFLFERSVRGPFVVGPFVRIIVTVVIPAVAGLLEHIASSDEKETSTPEQQGPKRNCCFRCLQGGFLSVARILGLIFHKDAGNVGGVGMLLKGKQAFGPWTNVCGSCPNGTSRSATVEAKAEGEEVKLLQSAVEQVGRKKFEARSELLEIKLSFLFVLFFAPVMPLGIFSTLVARLVEIRFKAVKLLFVRRRDWPEDTKTLHRTQGDFAQGAVVVAVLWHTGLATVSYHIRDFEGTLHSGFLAWLVSFVLVAPLTWLLGGAISRLIRYTKTKMS